MIFRRRGEYWVTLAAIAAIEFGLREQRADLWLATGGEQRQSVERTCQRALFDEFDPALTKPAGYLQSWIAIGAYETEAMAWRSFRGCE